MSTFAEKFDSYYTQIRHQRLYQDEAMNLDLSMPTVDEQPEIAKAQVVDSEAIEPNQDKGDTES